MKKFFAGLLIGAITGIIGYKEYKWQVRLNACLSQTYYVDGQYVHYDKHYCEIFPDYPWEKRK